jgi:dTDP-glucose 4,6-dehydratase
MKKILVTGGCGFIGTNLITELEKKFKKAKIINIDKFSYSSNTFLIKNNKKRVKNIKLNLLNYKKLYKILESFKPELLFHLAAETHVDASIKSPFAHYENNLKATLNLMVSIQELLEKKKLKKSFRFIHIGTDEVYGDLPLKSNLSFDEEENLSPNNPYSASKAAAILLVQSWHKNFKVPIIITNSVNNYGFFQFVEKFIPRSIVHAKEKKIIEVYGKGLNIRSWISVKDHVNALILISKKGKVGQTYNISTNLKLKNIVLAKKISTILKQKEIYSHIKYVKDRLGHDRQYSISSHKLRKLGWQPKVNFNEELKEIVEWYLKKENLKYFRKYKEHLSRKGL